MVLMLIVGAYFFGVYKSDPSQIQSLLKKETKTVTQVQEEPTPTREDITKIPVAMDLWQEMKTDPKIVVGKEDAPVTMVAFISGNTCKTCEQFQLETYPKIIKKYVDEGKVKVWIFPFAKEGGKKGEIDNVARAAGVSVNPTFFVAQYKLEGAQPYVSFESVIEKALAEAK